MAIRVVTKATHTDRQIIGRPAEHTEAEQALIVFEGEDPFDIAIGAALGETDHHQHQPRQHQQGEQPQNTGRENRRPPARQLPARSELPVPDGQAIFNH
jgi:hypothetical protein